jgi:diacylglycerol kinase family enzyme
MLADEPGAESLQVREFTVQVGDDAPAISVDGEAFDPKGLHVRVLPQALTVFSL